MADEVLLEKIHSLSDLELAALLCLVAQEHCIIDTEPEALDDLVYELKLVSTKTFGLSYAVIECSEHTTLDDFANSILGEPTGPESTPSPLKIRQESSYFLQMPGFTPMSRSPLTDNLQQDTRKIANILIAKDLDMAPKQVQIQVLELIRSKRIFTRTSVQAAPKRFLFMGLTTSGEGPVLTRHLNDHIFMSHFHDPEDGFANMEEVDDDGKSVSSVVRKTGSEGHIDIPPNPLFSVEDIDNLIRLSGSTAITVEVKRYLQNVITFLRLNHAVAGGISATATKHFDKLVTCLAPLHGLRYVTPSLVALAARKVYLHKIEITLPYKERSMQWGSDLDAVAESLEGIGPSDVIEEVLAMVEVPL